MQCESCERNTLTSAPVTSATPWERRDRVMCHQCRILEDEETVIWGDIKGTTVR